jgi:hypothetical protein
MRFCREPPSVSMSENACARQFAPRQTVVACKTKEDLASYSQKVVSGTFNCQTKSVATT